MKKIIRIIMACVLVLSLFGCSKSYQEATNGIETLNNGVCGGYFTEIVGWEDRIATYQVVYANDTKVKYFISKGTHKSGITPLYNTDGTLQVYEGE